MTVEQSAVPPEIQARVAAWHVDIAWDYSRFQTILMIRGKGPDGREYVAKPVHFEWVERTMNIAHEPTLAIDSIEPWIEAFRKLFPNAADTARLGGELEATKRHLADFRSLVLREKGINVPVEGEIREIEAQRYGLNR